MPLHALNTSNRPAAWASRTRVRQPRGCHLCSKVRRTFATFFINDTSGPVVFNEGIVCSGTPSKKYDIMYDDNDSEEMSKREFAHCSLPLKRRHMHTSHTSGGITVSKNVRSAFVPKVLVSSLVSQYSHFNPSTTRQRSPGIRKLDTSEDKYIFSFAGTTDNSGIWYRLSFSWNNAWCGRNWQPDPGDAESCSYDSSRKKAQKLSAYEADPIMVDDCLRAKNWETPKSRNSWKGTILNEIGNLMKFKVFDVIAWQDIEC